MQRKRIVTVCVDEVGHSCFVCQQTTTSDFVHNGQIVCSFTCLLKIRNEGKTTTNKKGKWEEQISTDFHSAPIMLESRTISL